MTPEEATAFGEKHCAVWNRHDLDAILGLYAEDVELTSPLAATLTGGGVIRGRDTLRSYFANALEKYPDLEFKLLNTLLCLDSVVLCFTRVSEEPVAEVLFLDDDRNIRRVLAHCSC